MTTWFQRKRDEPIVNPNVADRRGPGAVEPEPDRNVESDSVRSSGRSAIQPSRAPATSEAKEEKPTPPIASSIARPVSDGSFGHGGTASYGLILGFKGYGKTHLAIEYLDRWRRRGGNWTFIDSKGEYAALGPVVKSGREWSRLALEAIAQRRQFGIVVQRGEHLDFNALWKMLTKVGNQLLVIDEIHHYLKDPELVSLINTGRSKRLNIIATTLTPRRVPVEFKSLLDWCACFYQTYPYYAEQVAEDFFGGSPDVAARLLQLEPRHYLHSSSTGRVVAGKTCPVYW